MLWTAQEKICEAMRVLGSLATLIQVTFIIELQPRRAYFGCHHMLRSPRSGQ